MSFLSKKKQVAYETDYDIPSFFIDPNGFIIFDDRSLGGVAVLEVLPRACTESITWEDPVERNLKLNGERDFKSTTGITFDDDRRDVIEPWIRFLNDLHSNGEGDDDVHVQILAKKCTPSINMKTGAPYWETRLESAAYDASRSAGAFINGAMGSDVQRSASNRQRKAKGKESNVGRAIREERVRNYIGLLNALDEQDESEYPGFVKRTDVDVRRIPAYTVRFFMVISYTPTSEGWWMDGRDSDYYVSDSISVTSLFKDDKIVDNVTDLIMNHVNKKKNDDDDAKVGEFFQLDVDRTAQIIATRVNKVLRLARTRDAEHRKNPRGVSRMPFEFKRMDAREVGALVRFFPDILTPYWDRIWELASNQNDVIRGMDVDIAIATNDASILHDSKLDKSIADGTADMSSTTTSREAFLAQYRDKSLSDLSTISDDFNDANWSPSEDDEDKAAEDDGTSNQDFDEDIWTSIDETVSDLKGEASKRDEYLRRYKNRGHNGSVKNALGMRNRDDGDDKKRR